MLNWRNQQTHRLKTFLSNTEFKMKNKTVILGFFVTLGLTVLIVSVYIIGSKKDLFNPTTELRALFKDVNGLQVGNNVLYRGIEIGTVKKIEIRNDSTITVELDIRNSVLHFLKRNAIVSVGTDGLMGNKILVIKPSPDPGRDVAEGDTLQSQDPLETDQLFRTLSVTNDNMKTITTNLAAITGKFNQKNSLWTLLSDSTLAGNFASSVVNVKVISSNSALITGNLKNLTEGIQSGKGLMGALISDTTLSSRMKQVVVKLEAFSSSAALISGDFSKLSKSMNNENGSVGMLLKDTSFVRNLNESMKNIKHGSVLLNEDLDALKHSSLLKKYFIKKELSTPGN